MKQSMRHKMKHDMKRNAKHNAKHKVEQDMKGNRDNERNTRGFTIMETMVSLLLFSMSIILISRAVAGAVDAHKKSRLRTGMVQIMESQGHRLLAKNFSATELREGNYSGHKNPYLMSWNIKDIGPDMKRIHVSISYKGLTKRTYFYKSKHIL